MRAMGKYAVYVTDKSRISSAIADIESVGGKVLYVSDLTGLVVAELPENVIHYLMMKPYIRLIEKSYPFGPT